MKNWRKVENLFRVVSDLMCVGVWFGLVSFYGLSNIVGYLILNPLYTYL